MTHEDHYLVGHGPGTGQHTHDDADPAIEDNSHAGQGAVLLDIGADIGALVVHMPAGWIGAEIEICPAGADRSAEHRPHVGVVARPIEKGVAYTAVFPELVEGNYRLYRKPDGPVQLTVSVTGGQICEVRWPDA